MTIKKNHKNGKVKVKVVGIGGGGCNAVARIVRDRLNSTGFVCLNTDEQSLRLVPRHMRLTLGPELLHGLGAGGDPELGGRAAEDSKQEIAAVLREDALVFITAGMGGGTGTGAAPIVARLAKESGALVVGVVTRPFSFEGSTKRRLADAGILELEPLVDSLIVVPNDRLIALDNHNLSLTRAFKLADSALRQAIVAIAEVIGSTGEINVDFADVRSVLQEGGRCLFTVGQAPGAAGAEAAKRALSSPFLETDPGEARRALLTISGSRKLKLSQVQAIAEVVQQAIHPEAHIIFGVIIDRSLENQVRVTLIASTRPCHGTGANMLKAYAKEKPVQGTQPALDLDTRLQGTKSQLGQAITGVILEIDKLAWQITVSREEDEPLTLALADQTQLIKDGHEASIELLGVGDILQPASRYDPLTKVATKLQVKQRQSF